MDLHSLARTYFQAGGYDVRGADLGRANVTAALKALAR